MESIRNARNLTLYWAQPKSMQRSFVLHSAELEFASLEFQSAFGSLAIATTAEGSWSFKRMGFFNPRVTIRRSGEQAELGTYRPRWTGKEGTLSLSNGRDFGWRATNFWGTRYAFLDSAGDELLWFKEGAEESRLANLLKIQAQVGIEPFGWQLVEPELLVTLGWYLLILHHEDSAAAAAAVSAN